MHSIFIKSTDILQVKSLLDKNIVALRGFKFEILETPYEKFHDRNFPRDLNLLNVSLRSDISFQTQKLSQTFGQIPKIISQP